MPTRFAFRRPLTLSLSAGLAVALLCPNALSEKELDAIHRPDTPEVLPEPAFETSLAEVFAAPAPRSPSDLQALQDHVIQLVQRIEPATVCVSTGRGTGSGVIVSPDGYVLTAGHVFEEPGRRLEFFFPDGSSVRGISLGHNERIDSGLCKITDDAPEGGWPHAPIGQMSDVQVGDYVLALGHPGGFDRDRSVVTRLGRLVSASARVLHTDCSVVHGDSGGPLFDLHGRVIGIHSRIASSSNANYHIPIGTYLHTWGRLVDSELWGARAGRGDANLGLRLTETEQPGMLIDDIPERGPAITAPLFAGETLLTVEGQPIETAEDIEDTLDHLRPGDEVFVTVIANSDDAEPRRVRLTLGQ